MGQNTLDLVPNVILNGFRKPLVRVLAQLEKSIERTDGGFESPTPYSFYQEDFKMNTFYIRSSNLQHHGILGMHWGIRRFQPYPKGYRGNGKEVGKAAKKGLKGRRKADVKIPKGTRLNRIVSANEKDDPGRVYVSVTENDKKLYTHLGAREGVAGGTKNVTSLVLKAIEDLNIAGSKAQIESALKVIGDLPLDEIIGDSSVDTKYRRYKRKKYEKAIKEQDLSYVEQYFFDRIAKEDDVSKAYFEDLYKKGYNACIDFNNVPMAELPIILINREKSAKTISNKNITKAEIDAAHEYYREWVNKKNR